MLFVDCFPYVCISLHLSSSRTFLILYSQLDNVTFEFSCMPNDLWWLDETHHSVFTLTQAMLTRVFPFMGFSVHRNLCFCAVLCAVYIAIAGILWFFIRWFRVFSLRFVVGQNKWWCAELFANRWTCVCAVCVIRCVVDSILIWFVWFVFGAQSAIAESVCLFPFLPAHLILRVCDMCEKCRKKSERCLQGIQMELICWST